MVPMPKRVVFERSRRELSLGVLVGVLILLVVEQSSLESKSRGCGVPRPRYLRYITKKLQPPPVKAERNMVLAGGPPLFHCMARVKGICYSFLYLSANGNERKTPPPSQWS